MSKGSTTQKSEQTNNPPSWALPLLQKAAGDAMNLYTSGSGYNVYRGPTVAEYSPEKLAGLNKALTMTGYTGAPVSNEAMFGTDQIKQIQAMIDQQVADEKTRKAAAAAAAAAAAEAAKKKTYGKYGGMTELPGGGVGGRTGERGSAGYSTSSPGFGGASSAYGGYGGPAGGKKGGGLY